MKVGAIRLNQPSEPTGFSTREKRDALAREINLRRTVYPGRVRQQKMTHEDAEREIAIMHAIWTEFDQRLRSEGTEPQIDLSLETVPDTDKPAEPVPVQTPEDEPIEQKITATAAEDQAARTSDTTAPTSDTAEHQQSGSQTQPDARTSSPAP